jgi:hypothetical protein
MAPALSRSLPRFTLVSDLDGTLVDPSDPTHAALRRFNRLWEKYCAADCRLVYSTGRSHRKFLELRVRDAAARCVCVCAHELTRAPRASQRTTPLLAPDLLICSVGTEIYRRGAQGGVCDERWSATLEEGWQRDALLAAACGARGLTLQEPSEQRRHKLSLRSRSPGGCAGADAAVDELKKRLDATGAPYDLVVSSGCLDVDVLPRGANKGAALRFILEEAAEQAVAAAGCCPLSKSDALRACAEATLAAGDSGNDTQLLATEHVRAVVVANAQPELRAWAKDAGPTPRVFVATQRCADGIIEALKHFGFVLSDACADEEADGVA